jgi:hypothetical protein
MSKITGGGSADGRSRAEASAVYGYDIMIRMGKSQRFLKGEETARFKRQSSKKRGIEPQRTQRSQSGAATKKVKRKDGTGNFEPRNKRN